MKVIMTEKNTDYFANFKEEEIGPLLCEANGAQSIDQIMIFLSKYGFQKVIKETEYIIIDEYPISEPHYVYDIDSRKVLTIIPGKTDVSNIHDFLEPLIDDDTELINPNMSMYIM